MPQGSLFNESELHKLHVTLALDELHQRSLIQLVATNRKGDVLASSGLILTGIEETELLPALLSECGYGWAVGGARECVTTPAGAFRARRRSLQLRGR